MWGRGGCGWPKIRPHLGGPESGPIGTPKKAISDPKWHPSYFGKLTKIKRFFLRSEKKVMSATFRARAALMAWDSHVSPTVPGIPGTVQPASRQTLAPRQQVTAGLETYTRHPGSTFRHTLRH
jgi:hypothetical protein